MKQFKSIVDINQLPSNHPARVPVKEHLGFYRQMYDSPSYPCDPDSCGWVVLIEEVDIDRKLSEIWTDWKLADVPWENAYKDGDFIIALFIPNDDFKLTFIIPSGPAIYDELPQTLKDIIN